ncbi:hypothetical protein PVLB_07745 [Pseudomonas sp. VLB120]|nr:hypothetical protein PVLB_07745 [Pseudomonas sp. VLB120]
MPAPCPVSVTWLEPAWFFLGFVEDWVKVCWYPPGCRPESAQRSMPSPHDVAKHLARPIPALAVNLCHAALLEIFTNTQGRAPWPANRQRMHKRY